MQDTYGLGYQFGDAAAPQPFVDQSDTYGLGYQFGDAATPQPFVGQSDTYGLTYQFGGAAIPQPFVGQSDTYGLTYQFGDLILLPQLPVMGCVDALFRVRDGKLQCFDTSTGFTLMRCVDTLFQSRSNLACIETTFHAKQGILSHTEARWGTLSVNPVTHCVETRLSVASGYVARNTEFGRRWFTSDGVPLIQVSPPIPPSEQLPGAIPPPPGAPVTEPTVDDVAFGQSDPQSTGTVLAEGMQVTFTPTGLAVPFQSAVIRSEIGSYAHELELTVTDADIWQVMIPYATSVRVVFGSYDFVFLVEDRTQRLDRGSWQYSVSARSHTIRLGDVLSSRINRSFEGQRLSQVIRDLALVQNIQVDYLIEDVIINEGAVSASDQSPIDIIVGAVEALGGLVRSHPNEPRLIIEYPEALTGSYTATLTGLNSVKSVQDVWDWRRTYSSVIVSEASINGDDVNQEPRISLQQVGDKVRGFITPFNALTLRDSADPGTELVYDGVFTEVVKDELTVICGESQLSKPFHELIFHGYLRTDLGLITITESGKLTTELKGSSLLNIEYLTKFHQWSLSLEDDRSLVYVPG